MKANSKGDTQHREEIPTDSWESIMDLLKILQAIMRSKKDTPEYMENVKKLPLEYQDSYHFLMHYAIIFLLLALFARRGREGIDSLTKSHFEKKFDKKNNYYFYQKVKGELTKNHR